MTPPETRWWHTPVAVVLWWVGLCWMIPMMTLMMVVSAVVGARRIEGLSRLYCRGQIALTGSRWRAVVHPGVDPRQSYVFAQNHANLFDHVVLYPATPHFKQGLELEEHFKIPVYGWFMKARGTIPVKKSAGGQGPEVLDRMRREIALGGSILAFPEAHRTLDGRVRPLRKGVFFIARDLGLPVVPVAVTGTWAMNRKGDWRIFPGWDITVFCDAPIPTAGLTDDEIPALAERVHAALSARIDAWDRERSAAAG
jgi:1-acyl-sn-glycerol-3-phosphate acyltransferase